MMHTREITAAGMRAVMVARGWTPDHSYTAANGLVYEVWNHATAHGLRRGARVNVLLPTRRMEDGSDDARTESWAEATAARHGNTTADAVLFEAWTASRNHDAP